MKSAFLLVTFFFFIDHSTVAALASPPSELEALLTIKANLVDPNASLADWTLPSVSNPAPTAYCNWTGIGCNGQSRVKSIDISCMNLTGCISDAILSLSELTHLDVSCNALTSMPRNLSSLLHLRVFDVSDNQLVGRFPEGLGRASELRVVNASGNNFSGRLPEDLANAAALEILDLQGGYFDGSIPICYKSLKNLRFLGLSGNNLTGRLPAELGQLPSLETMIIGYNWFDGPIPRELGQLHNLRYLDVAVAGISGSIPPEIGQLKSLETIYLFKNRIGGEIPIEIGNMTSLTSLDLSDNQIKGEIPNEVTQLVNLQLLNLMCNNLNGQVPSGLGELTRLEVLALWNNSLSGPLPVNLGRNSPLQWLDVSTNLLSGEIPPALCSGGNLTKLILFNNGFTGPIPGGLPTCTSLVRVRLHNNRINGSIPTGFGKLPRIQRLELAGNELTGPVPDDIVESKSLSFIDLSHNQLQFSLPNNIFSIPTLQTFIAEGNNLTGPIPDKFELCQSLTVLDLSSNNLSGTIPPNLVSCQRLVSLDLSYNSLTGDIPMTIAKLPTLSILDLSHNQLSGPIPCEFGGSPALETLDLSFNNLSGPVPATGILKTIDPSELSGNPLLCGGVLPQCDASSSKRHTNKHLAGIVVGWGIGTTAAIGIMVMVVGWRWVYERCEVVGLWCEGCGRGGGGEWPWRLMAFQRVSFTSDEVLAAVKEENVIGMGASGVVYKADLPRHRAVVAVKKLWSTGDDHIDEEANLLGRLRHRNIVRVMGLLHNDSDSMVVYEYLENGSLWEALHGAEVDSKHGGLFLDWLARYNIAAGIAAGLAYLHHDCRPPVVHRDVKSANILLDGNMEAKLADFGLARTLVGRKGEGTLSVIIGSQGYLAPECAYALEVDEKSDIYSFGVVLLELLTSKKPVGLQLGDAQDLVSWVRRSLRPGSGHQPEDILDPTISGPCRHMEEMVLVLRIALLCTAPSPKDRPSMRDVVTMLAEAKPRRKSSSVGTVVKSVVVNEKPVFTAAPTDLSNFL